ncbi:MAG: STAS domain-containing protein [Candidatus Kapabacteria bacterium]|nr:STAS domain-containing protein [Candidatus Kapabacteria bacterium]
MKHEQLDVCDHDRATVLTLRGQFIGGDETDALRTALAACNKDAGTTVVLDMAGVTYVNSSCIGVLLAAHAHASRKQGSIVIAGADDAVRDVFTITKMHLVFRMYETLQDALSTSTNNES